MYFINRSAVPVPTLVSQYSLSSEVSISSNMKLLYLTIFLEIWDAKYSVDF